MLTKVGAGISDVERRASEREVCEQLRIEGLPRKVPFTGCRPK